MDNLTYLDALDRMLHRYRAGKAVHVVMHPDRAREITRLLVFPTRADVGVVMHTYKGVEVRCDPSIPPDAIVVTVTA
jgi:hypothetical protein